MQCRRHSSRTPRMKNKEKANPIDTLGAVVFHAELGEARHELS